MDEVYAQVVWGNKHTYLSEVCNQTPAIVTGYFKRPTMARHAAAGWSFTIEKLILNLINL